MGDRPNPFAGYYAKKLSGERLREVYLTAPPRARAYLEDEIAFIERSAPREGRILELGCGYGRVLGALAAPRRALFGIDTSIESLLLAREVLRGERRARLACMDAAGLGFLDRTFDLTVSAQNGIAAFHVDRRALVREAVRVTRPGGRVLFSSYAERFWEGRLEWFRAQAARGLVGAIDEEATRNGVIACKDGLRLETVGADAFRDLVSPLGLPVRIEEVASSSLFCIISVE
ncbi:MAG: class I SAM-dependent methyltransferase [Candidatus Eisenbacteria bacterium]|nr:class I SAM-dependent methyltransferase [Candidatus Eisenbacteria bacterium]